MLCGFFDATLVAEFLYECVKTTIENDLPREISYLLAHDKAEARIIEYVEMPNKLAQDLTMFVRHNGGAINDGDGQVETLLVVWELEGAGYEVKIMDWGMHNTTIDSIMKNDVEFMPNGKNSQHMLGYDNSRDYLPQEIIGLLDGAFP